MTECNYEFTRQLKEKLSKKESKYLLKLMSEMCEASYRRGVQQALYLHVQNKILPKFYDKDKIYNWRYAKKSNSVGLDGYNSSSLDRFMCENSEWENFL